MTEPTFPIFRGADFAPYEVRLYAQQGVWALHRAFTLDEFALGVQWTITHLPSGLALLSTQFKDRCLDALRELGEHCPADGWGAEWGEDGLPEGSEARRIRHDYDERGAKEAA